jgi:hypothetical protein
VALAIGLAGLVLTGVGIIIDPRQAYASWLAAFAAGLSVALGALILVAATHLTGARWFDPLRGLALDIAATLPLFALFFLVLVPGMARLYPWVGAPRPANRTYLNPPFFLARAAIYFAVWIAVAFLLRRWALLRSPEAARPPAGRERALAAASLPALGFTGTFAAFDWLMSLAPAWVSTVFGVYWFAGGFLGALAAVAVAGFAASSAGTARARIGPDQAYALGALMITFVIFWGYIAYCQYLIVWIADVPAEVAWYLPRVRGGWGTVALVLLVGHLALPFLVLVFHAAKTSWTVLALVAAWLLVMHYLDTYWIVLPQLHPRGIVAHWLDLSALAGVAGTAAAWAMWVRERGRFRMRPPAHGAAAAPRGASRGAAGA